MLYVLFSTLQEALDALQQDEVMSSALGKEFVAWYTQLKQVGEINVLANSDVTVNTEEALKQERDMYAVYM